MNTPPDRHNPLTRQVNTWIDADDLAALEAIVRAESHRVGYKLTRADVVRRIVREKIATYGTSTPKKEDDNGS